MKIHMDYLEGKVEKLQKEQDSFLGEQTRMQQKIESLKTKLKDIQEDRDLKEAQI